MTFISPETLPLGFGRGTHKSQNTSACSSSFFLNQGFGEPVSVFLVAKQQAGRFLNSYSEVNHFLREKWKCETLFSMTFWFVTFGVLWLRFFWRQWSESCSVMSNSLQPHGLYSPWNSIGQNTEVGSCSLPWGIFPTQELNPVLPPCRQILYQLNYQGDSIYVN